MARINAVIEDGEVYPCMGSYGERLNDREHQIDSLQREVLRLKESLRRESNHSSDLSWQIAAMEKNFDYYGDIHGDPKDPDYGGTRKQDEPIEEPFDFKEAMKALLEA